MAIKGPAKQANNNQGQALSPGSARSQSAGKPAVPLVDNRPEAVVQRRLQELAKDNPGVVRLNALQKMADNNPDVARLNTLQAMVNTNPGVASLNALQKMANNSAGLPDPLKQGIEHLSGIPMDDVRVHRNSDRPAQLKALAYAQGTDIHLGPGQEKHLPHEAWHVVQQKQGRVKPTLQAKGQINLNDDAGLEKEADLMGAKAMAVNPMPLQEHQGFSAAGSTTDTMQLKVQGADGKILERPGLMKALRNQVDKDGVAYRSKLYQRLKAETTHKHNSTSEEKLNAHLKPNAAPRDKFSALAGAMVNKNKERVYSELGEMIDPSYAHTFTIQMVKDYLDGKKVPGMTLLGKGDILAPEAEPEEILASGSAEEKSLARVKKLKQTVERLNINRQAQSAKETAVIGADGKEQYEDENTQRIAEHFRNTVWYYGTTGEDNRNKEPWKNVMAWTDEVKKKLRPGYEGKSYSAGTRNTAYLDGMAKSSAPGGDGKNHQMMDMYYGGQEYEAWQTMRDPIIGAYIHRMMGYEGEYNQAESPDTTFRKNFPLGGDASKNQNRGWSWNAKPASNTGLADAGLPAEWANDKSATMEISRMVRKGVEKFGGTIVFEGSGIYWAGVFVKGARQSDTTIEAEAILPELIKSGGSRAAIGKGEYVFHWRGKETIPTRSIFLSMWRSYGKDYKEISGGEVIDSSGGKSEEGVSVEFTSNAKNAEKNPDGTDKHDGTKDEHYTDTTATVKRRDTPEPWFWAFPAR
jgi:hypothetical protein